MRRVRLPWRRNSADRRLAAAKEWQAQERQAAWARILDQAANTPEWNARRHTERPES